jgi:PAS domain S-box-containing protein
VPTPLRILLIEDSEDDALLLLRELRRGGYEPKWQRVDTATALEEALSDQWDLITCDYVMPGFSGPAALEILQAHDVEAPVVIVSGEVGDEVAVTVMKAGAHDYVSKHKLTRLLPAVERELREADVRRARRRAEAALQESEERFRQSFESAPIGMALVAPDGHWLRVNRALCEIIGYTEAELLGTSFQAVTHPDDLETDLAYVQQMLAGEICTYQLAKRYYHKRGHVVWILLSVSLVRDPDGRPLYFIAQIQDVTEQQRAEKALRQSQADLQAILNNSLQSFVLTDRAGIIKAFNQIASVRSEVLLGARPLLEGESIYDSVPEQYQADFQADFAHARDGDTVVVERAIIDRHGAEHWLEFNFVPVRERETTVSGVCLSVLDINDRKQAEAALVRAQRRLQTYIDQATDLIFTLDAEGRITSVNDKVCVVTGHLAPELLGRSPLQLVATDSLDNTGAALAAILGGSSVAQAEVQIVTKDGRRVWLEIRGWPIYEGEQRVETFHIARDITERKRAETTRSPC